MMNSALLRPEVVCKGALAIHLLCGQLICLNAIGPAHRSLNLLPGHVPVTDVALIVQGICGRFHRLHGLLQRGVRRLLSCCSMSQAGDIAS